MKRINPYEPSGILPDPRKQEDVVQCEHVTREGTPCKHRVPYPPCAQGRKRAEQMRLQMSFDFVPLHFLGVW